MKLFLFILGIVAFGIIAATSVNQVFARSGIPPFLLWAVVFSIIVATLTKLLFDVKKQSMSRIAPILLLLLLITFIVGCGLSLYSTLGTQPLALTIACVVVFATSRLFSDEPLIAPRFSIRNMLTATFCVCLWFAALISFPSHAENAWQVIIVILCFFYIMVGPFVVLGALAGHAKQQLQAGFVVAVFVVFLVIFLIPFWFVLEHFEFFGWAQF